MSGGEFTSQAFKRSRREDPWPGVDADAGPLACESYSWPVSAREFGLGPVPNTDAARGKAGALGLDEIKTGGDYGCS